MCKGFSYNMGGALEKSVFSSPFSVKSLPYLRVADMALAMAPTSLAPVATDLRRLDDGNYFLDDEDNYFVCAAWWSTYFVALMSRSRLAPASNHRQGLRGRILQTPRSSLASSCAVCRLHAVRQLVAFRGEFTLVRDKIVARLNWSALCLANTVHLFLTTRR